MTLPTQHELHFLVIYHTTSWHNRWLPFVCVVTHFSDRHDGGTEFSVLLCVDVMLVCVCVCVCVCVSMEKNI